MIDTRPIWKITAAIVAVCVMMLGTPHWAFAEDAKYRLGEDSLVNTGKDNGFSGTNPVTKDDVHWGWQVGAFYVSGFTRVIEDGAAPVFLKNVGDEVALWFELEQDIDRLNGDESLSISEDANGWDQRLNVPQQDFGRGMLIVKSVDHANDTETTVYKDFLAAEASTTAITEVGLFEEGDYEVALDYEVAEPRINLLGWKPAYKHTNYQVSFAFSVRNGNSMVFPFDLQTGDELTNAASTPNGFRLDLAKSKYLDVDVKREVLNEESDALVEDVRFNRPAHDGSEYTDEGTYTISVSNRYTGQETVKTIYVGTDEVLRAHAATGESVSSIKSMIAQGATIADDGSINLPDGSVILAEFGSGLDAGAEAPVQGASESRSAQVPAESDPFMSESSVKALLLLGGAAAVAAAIAIVVFWSRRRARLASVSQGF